MNIVGRTVGLAVIASALTGCHGPPPERTITVSNPAYRVEQLFTDPAGNTVYKFVDDGEPRYYVSGPNNPQVLQPPKKKDNDLMSSTDPFAVDTPVCPPQHGHK